MVLGSGEPTPKHLQGAKIVLRPQLPKAADDAGRFLDDEGATRLCAPVPAPT